MQLLLDAHISVKVVCLGEASCRLAVLLLLPLPVSVSCLNVPEIDSHPEMGI